MAREFPRRDFLKKINLAKQPAESDHTEMRIIHLGTWEEFRNKLVISTMEDRWIQLLTPEKTKKVVQKGKGIIVHYMTQLPTAFK